MEIAFRFDLRSSLADTDVYFGANNDRGDYMYYLNNLILDLADDEYITNIVSSTLGNATAKFNICENGLDDDGTLTIELSLSTSKNCDKNNLYKDDCKTSILNAVNRYVHKLNSAFKSVKHIMRGDIWFNPYLKTLYVQASPDKNSVDVEWKSLQIYELNDANVVLDNIRYS